MINIELFAIKKLFKPEIKSDVSGRLRIRVKNYSMIPKNEVTIFLPSVINTLKMLNGITDVQVNSEIGSILILYNSKITDSKIIMNTIELIISTILDSVPDLKDRNLKNQNEIEAYFMEILKKLSIFHS